MVKITSRTQDRSMWGQDGNSDKLVSVGSVGSVGSVDAF